jgi:uncharacterized alpha/beta hydrolase family protein
MRFITLICLAFLVSCSSSSNLMQRKLLAKNIAEDHGYKRSLIKTSNFVLTVFSKITRNKKPVSIYIEGDGRAWVSKRRVSNNPTPQNPLALKLSILDKSENVIYIARPCQYTKLEKDGLCKKDYWTGKRFAPEVIKSFDETVSYILKKYDLKGVNLIGFSGGANVASLLANNRDDVLSIRTVAGNLDHEYLNSYHKVSKQYGSLNAIDYAKNISHIPQIHFFGTKDKIIPVDMAERFLSASGDKCVKTFANEGATHLKNWLEKWQDYLAMPINCQ